jgi:hypothetical protein
MREKERVSNEGMTCFINVQLFFGLLIVECISTKLLNFKILINVLLWVQNWNGSSLKEIKIFFLGNLRNFMCSLL